MRTIENSKVDLAEKMDYLILPGEKYSLCQQTTRMPSSTKSDTSDQFDADFTEEAEKLSSSPRLYDDDGDGLIKEYKEELFRISDKTIDLEAKNLLSDSGCFLPDSEEDETSLHSETRSEETTDPDSEGGQDEGDSEDAEGGTVMVPDDEDDLSASQDSKNDAEDSCEMTYIELDLSSQSHEDVSDDFELMMKNLQIGTGEISVHSDSHNSDSSDVTPVKICDGSFDEENVKDAKQDDISEEPVLDLDEDVEGQSGVISLCSAGREYASSNLKQATRPEFYGSFLPNSFSASSLCSLSEKTYFQIAERLLDDQTSRKLNAEEIYLSNYDCCGAALDTPDIPSEMVSSNQSSFASGETDPAYKMCPMTYVDLDINEPCPEDLAVKMLNTLSIKDDKSPLCRGFPSNYNVIQTPPLCSEIDVSDFEVPCIDLLIDDPPFSIDRGGDSEMDFTSSLANVLNVSSMPGFYSSQTFSSFSAEFDFQRSALCLPSYSSDYFAKTYKTSSGGVNTVGERPPISSPRCSVLPPSASIPYVDSSFGVSFFDDSLEDCETHYENKFVTENLHILEEIDEFLGLSNPETPQTIPPSSSLPSTSPPPLSSSTVPNLFSSHPCLPPLETPFPTTRHSLYSNAIPRVTTQTPTTQSDAIPAFPGILVVLSTTSSIHGLKRPTCIEMSEPAKKPFGYDNFNNSGLSEADSRKKAKQVVASLTDKQLLEFANNESRLHEAVRTTNYEYVLALLKRLINLDSHNQDIINSKNVRSQTPLHLAVQANIPAIVHLLIKYGAEVNHLAMTASKKLEVPLHYVASQGIHFKLVLKCLLEANDLDINIKNSEGQTALHCAAVAHGTAGSRFAHSIDSEYIIKKLLTKGADPLIQDNNGKNVLMYAIESKDLNLVSNIVKNVCKEQIPELLAATTSNGQTSLSLAHSLKEQFTHIQWDKLINILTRHTANN